MWDLKYLSCKRRNECEIFGKAHSYLYVFIRLETISNAAIYNYGWYNNGLTQTYGTLIRLMAHPMLIFGFFLYRGVFAFCITFTLH